MFLGNQRYARQYIMPSFMNECISERIENDGSVLAAHFYCVVVLLSIFVRKRYAIRRQVTEKSHRDKKRSFWLERFQSLKRGSAKYWPAVHEIFKLH